jgi:3-hydroxyisobutyrate dehydrogenase-like beta-hydroxyacid dehydrogenase
VALDAVGFVGLGNMGSALASNLVTAGLTVAGYDAAGADRAPVGVRFVPSVADLVQWADVLIFSLPNGDVSERVAQQVIESCQRRVTHIVEMSTIGVATAQNIADRLGQVGLSYVDAPVSGGPAGARARTLAIMYAGLDEDCTRVEPVLARLSDRRYRVGDRPGLGQAMKLANNFLSATALAATSEAVAFGRSVGLDMARMLQVLGASSGQNTAVTDKFPNQVLTGRYASGFSNSLMLKDLQHYLRAVEERGGPRSIGVVTTSVWKEFAAKEPGADFTRIYPYVAGS